MMDRRSFLKMSAAGLGALALDGAATLPALANENRLTMLYDNAKCVGCRACQMACKQWNKLGPVSTDPVGIYESPEGLSPDVWTLIKLANYPLSEGRSFSFINVGCMHCGEPACAAVCPTGALQKQPNGLVTHNRDLCNGCGYCTQFCPFHIPQLQVSNQLTGAAKSSKCTFCQDRVSQGLRPFCVQSCPVGALDWGDREAMLTKAKSRVEVLKAGLFPEANLYGDTQLGGLGRLYVLLAPPEVYGLPADPRFPFSVTLWQMIIQPVGGVALTVTTIGALIVYLLSRQHIEMTEVE